jgi:molybdopterin/thiamine biosynthesis adenylyltransferase
MTESETAQSPALAALRLGCVGPTERLIDALARRGFFEQTHQLGVWRGWFTLQDPPQRVAIDVHVTDGYPYAAPRIKPLTRRAAEACVGSPLSDYYEASNSWHQERDGALCLFEDQDRTLLPWSDPELLLHQIGAWLAADRAGWPDDAPSLDLERYLLSSGRLVLHEDVRPLAGRVVQLQALRRDVFTTGRPLQVPRGRRGARTRWPERSALVLDIGALSAPIRDQAGLLAAAGVNRSLLEQEVGNGIKHLLLAYSRGGVNAILALEIRVGSAGTWTLSAHRSASTTPGSLILRSNPRRADLEQRRVAVVGVGAIGGVVADLLHREGVGALTLVDPDIVMPGNLVRHLAGDESVGAAKVDAVKRALHATRPAATTAIEPRQAAVSTIDDACAVLASHDLVVDASADSNASALLAAAAAAGAGRVLAVAVLADGHAARIDHWPPPASGALATTELPPRHAGIYEAGCSSPVSATPPHAVWEAASMAVRHAVQTLLGDQTCAGEERLMNAGPTQ